MYRTVINVFLLSLVVTAASATDFMLGMRNNSFTCSVARSDVGLTIFEYIIPRSGSRPELCLMHHVSNGAYTCPKNSPFTMIFRSKNSTSFVSSLSFNAIEDLNDATVSCRVFNDADNRRATWNIRIISTLDCEVYDDGSGGTIFEYQMPGKNYTKCELQHSQQEGTTLPCGNSSLFTITARDGYGTESAGNYVSSFHLNEAKDPTEMTVQCFSKNGTSLVQSWYIQNMMQDSEQQPTEPNIIASSVCTVTNLLATSGVTETTVPVSTFMSTLMPTPTPTLISTPTSIPVVAVATKATTSSAMTSFYDMSILFMLLNLSLGI